MTAARWTAATGGILLLLLSACGQRATSIEPSPKTLVIYGAGRSKDISANVLDRHGAVVKDAAITWSCSNIAIADCTPDGHITSKKPGTAVLTATYEKLSATVPLEVAALAEIDVAPIIIKLTGPPGTSYQAAVVGKTAGGKPAQAPAHLKWTSENPRVAAVSEDGTVTAVGNGKTTVRASADDLLGEAEVDVAIRNIFRLELRPETAILHPGDTARFSVIGYDDTGLSVPNIAARLSSSNPAAVTVAGDGTVTAVAVGSATITATLGTLSGHATVLVSQ